MKVTIDATRFKSVAKEYGYSLKALSQKIGYSDTYLSNCALAGEMEERVVNAIELLAGIPRGKFLDNKNYIPKEEMTDDELRLYSVINKACYDTFVGALKKWGGIL